MADFTNRNADETKQFILTFDENGGSPEYTKIEDANGVDRTAEVVDLLGINDKEDADPTILKEADVEDSLNSTSTTKPLSANHGKQLNDDKASLSGGADADFAVMPLVDGSPIVERDSNSDGEWIRFANGTQIAIRFIDDSPATEQNQNPPINFTNSFTRDYPASFESVTFVSASATGAAWASARDGIEFGPNDQEWNNIRLISDRHRDSGREMYLSAIGRWK